MSEATIPAALCPYRTKNLTGPQKSSFLNPGFNNWKKSYENVKEHENSANHRKSMLTWLDRVNTKHRIDKTMAEKMLNEKKYWVKVLHRVVSVVKFLAVHGLAFEGNDSRLGSPSNGNFLGILEVISEFDPFLKQHMNESANKGSGNVSYFSMRICNEIIDLMANEVLLEITKQLQETKYFGLILDSTPDRAHRDQFAVVVRYCYKGLVVERFLTYIHILSHTGISMVEEAQIKKKCSVALFAPCFAHSLNLVGSHAVKSCLEAINFFGVVQKLYAFFAASTHRWNLLLTGLKSEEKNKIIVLKTLNTLRLEGKEDKAFDSWGKKDIEISIEQINKNTPITESKWMEFRKETELEEELCLLN
ncbi:uncharacterized protein LOC112694616 [Sipha flava]|uniref:Uncharacterized protein LOC112694616 n=1 Tax=Sipha flava TaxID=143950 RepID=A0A8B8GRN8_9HEMI|nr:uncharacterized protein LOC112694616 [Sipha flava]